MSKLIAVSDLREASVIRGFEGEHLIYTTPETVDTMDGRLCTCSVEFERA